MPARQEEALLEDDAAFTTHLAFMADRFGCQAAQEIA
jgi:hypothetical protein